MGRRTIVFDEADRLISSSRDGVTGASASLSSELCMGLAGIAVDMNCSLDDVLNPPKELRLSGPEISSQPVFEGASVCLLDPEALLDLRRRLLDVALLRVFELALSPPDTDWVDAGLRRRLRVLCRLLLWLFIPVRPSSLSSSS